jgi:hypothetical protein
LRASKLRRSVKDGIGRNRQPIFELVIIGCFFVNEIFLNYIKNSALSSCMDDVHGFFDGMGWVIMFKQII